MINENFSAASFAKKGLDTDASRELADLLELEIGQELRLVIDAKVTEIVTTLNSMGHNLRLEQETTVGEISFRDDSGSGDNYHCNLRVAFHYVTSAGYADLAVAGDFE